MSFRSKSFWALTLLLALAVTSAIIGLRFTGNAGADSADEYKELQVFTEVLSAIKHNYVEEVETKDLVYDAMRGMLRSLDPHSSFMTPEDFKEMKVDTKGEFGGLGIQISIRNGVLTVIAPIEDTPAWRAGIEAGDKILKIEEESTKDMTLHEAVSKMRGKRGTKITISIFRDSFKKLRQFSIIRDLIKIKSVKSRMMKDNIGYVKLSQFQKRSADDMYKTLKDLKKEGAEGIVLDLRNNPGGLLDSAVEISSFFLPKGKMVVYTMDRYGSRDEYRSRSKTFSDKIPMTVLVNQGSASASEIVSGALKDWKRAMIIGVTTFGKGSVQKLIPLSDGAGLRITTSKYYTPNNISIQNTGIKPDIEVKLTPPEGKDGHPVLRESDLEGRLDNEQTDRDDNISDNGDKPEEVAVSLRDLKDEDDTQLQRALELLRTWITYKKMPEALNEKVKSDS
jgi:carboxyl-terminal processing protease